LLNDTHLILKYIVWWRKCYTVTTSSFWLCHASHLTK